ADPGLSCCRRVLQELKSLEDVAEIGSAGVLQRSQVAAGAHPCEPPVHLVGGEPGYRGRSRLRAAIHGFVPPIWPLSAANRLLPPLCPVHRPSSPRCRSVRLRTTLEHTSDKGTACPQDRRADPRRGSRCDREGSWLGR